MTTLTEHAVKTLVIRIRREGVDRRAYFGRIPFVGDVLDELDVREDFCGTSSLEWLDGTLNGLFDEYGTPDALPCGWGLGTRAGLDFDLSVLCDA